MSGQSQRADERIWILIKSLVSLPLLLVSHLDNKNVSKVFANPNILYFAEFHNMKDKANILKYLVGSATQKFY